MKLFAFTDLHGNLSALQKIERKIAKEKPDVILCLGDFTVFEQDMEVLLRRISKLGKVLLIHGNHEEQERTQALCQEYESITYLHKQAIVIDGWTFAGFGGGGFSSRYPELEECLAAWENLEWRKTVFLSHAPPYGTALDNVGDEDDAWHVGSKSLRDICRKYGPALVLAGHIHECFGEQDMIKGTILNNPGPTGMFFELTE